MGRKSYLTDIAAAQSARLHGFLPGSDGEFTFLFTDPQTNVRINAFIPDTSEYPKHHQCLLYLNDDASSGISKKLQSYPNSPGRTIQEIITTVITHLLSISEDEHLDTSQHNEADEVASLASNASDDMELINSEDEWDFNEIDNDSRRQPVDQDCPHVQCENHSARLLQDFCAVKQAGWRIGTYGKNPQKTGKHFSVSCRISKLGISEEAMQAWQVKPTNYLVLLLHYPQGYRSWDELARLGATNTSQYLKLRVGQCTNYKPANPETHRNDLPKDVDPDHISTPDLGDEQKPLFKEILISKALDELLQTRFISLIKIRREYAFGWSAAEAFSHDVQGAITTSINISASAYYHLDEEDQKSFGSKRFEDQIGNESDSRLLSIPLVAFQFTLRHFVRCPEFCQICHTKIAINLDAIKPYVCGNPLCLYQYMSLGFGPSIEHEILNQPLVVDLLISFCYQGALNNQLRLFPKGLAWKVLEPLYRKGSISTNAKPSSYLSSDHWAQARRPTENETTKNDHQEEKFSGTLRRRERHLEIKKFAKNPSNALFGVAIETSVNPNVRQSDWIMIKDEDKPENPLWHCKILEVRDSILILSDPVIENNPESTEKNAPNIAKEANVTFRVYNIHFDDLSSSDMSKSIISMLNIMPSVPEMSNFLIKNPGKSLLNWTMRFPPAVFGLLRWIIVSNRSCVFQADEILLDTISTENSNNKIRHSIVRPSEERVRGMSGWLQFRFAMGAPDKEQRFIESVTSHSTSEHHPTIFGWHGSPLHNWHSIIREGLHFQTTAHGRAYGHGVYHARDLNTSLGYTNRSFALGAKWPQSLLKLQSAVALSEIVNAPSKFESRNPFYVVQHTDWIQTRYLFVQPTDLTTDTSETLSSTLPQDPNHTPTTSSGTKIELPLAAISTSRRPTKISKASNSQTNGKTKSKKSNKILAEQEVIDLTADDSDTESIASLEEDIEFLKSANECSLREPSEPVTPYTPHSPQNLPLLESPQYATSSASRRLQKDLMALRNSQDSAINANKLSELGWYLDPDHLTKTDNLYQWIISLHSFPQVIPLGQDMMTKDIESIVLEFRFAATYPISPPFVRVIRPRFLPFSAGGGGHVTLGGSICMDLLTNSGWTAVSDIESVLLQIRMALMNLEPRPARLEVCIPGFHGGKHQNSDYGVGEAVEAFIRVCQTHGWVVPKEIQEVAAMTGITG